MKLRLYFLLTYVEGEEKKSRQQVLHYIIKTITPRVNSQFKWPKQNVSRIKIRYNTSLYLKYCQRYGLYKIASIFCFSHIYIVILSFLTKTQKLENGCFNIFCCIFDNIRVTETCTDLGSPIQTNKKITYLFHQINNNRIVIISDLNLAFLPST